MRFLMNTCVFSELFKARVNPFVQAWMDHQPSEDIFLSVMTLGEIRKGISKLSDESKIRFLEERLSMVSRNFEAQILDLGQAELIRWGRMCGRSEKRKITLPVVDSLIAATAQEHGLVVATRNVKDFERCGVEVVNPWEG